MNPFHRFTRRGTGWKRSGVDLLDVMILPVDRTNTIGSHRFGPKGADHRVPVNHQIKLPLRIPGVSNRQRGSRFRQEGYVGDVQTRIARKRIGGGNIETLLEAEDGNHQVWPTDWSNDEKYIIYSTGFFVTSVESDIQFII